VANDPRSLHRQGDEAQPVARNPSGTVRIAETGGPAEMAEGGMNAATYGDMANRLKRQRCIDEAVRAALGCYIPFWKQYNWRRLETDLRHKANRGVFDAVRREFRKLMEAS
jgi:hypothetical protein